MAAHTVHVLGDEVHLLDGTEIDASDGGTILVGGDREGKNPEVKNAQRTWVGKETLLNANGGGKVIVWANERTAHFGKIDISSVEGDGGFAEVSAKDLTYQGMTDGRAPNGKPGTIASRPHQYQDYHRSHFGRLVECLSRRHV